MSHESIYEHLLISARKWARTAVDACLEEPINQDFAVHHMAVAVEHASKAYLASIAPGLLASEKQPSVDDLLVLSGNEDRTKKGRAGLKTIGGEGAILRAAQLLGPEHRAPAKLKELRESRNGITHMGWGQPVTECRELLAAGIEHINALLKALSTEPGGFWGTHLEACTTTGAQTADLLKDLTERIRATFVYAGIDVTTTALFSGVRGAQLAGRASLVECGAFPARLGKHEPFRELITGVEAALDLQAHQPGTLPRHAAYLHQRTAGRIGSLTRLIRQAAITAISDGTERITKTSLEAIRLDHLAETHHRPTPNRPTTPHR
ncbi:hypothetical protein ACWDX6_24975 [Streptomyces sp. NPDC003027]